MSAEARGPSAVAIPHTVSALIHRDATILLVQERAATDTVPTWMLPGGQVERGESLESALRREVREETGLELAGSPVPAFDVEIDARLDDLAGTWRAVTYASDTTGDVVPADPDGLVLSAEWVPVETALQRLEQVEWYDSGPLRAFLSGAAPPGSRYRYRLEGRRGAVVRSAVEVLDDDAC